MLSKEYYREMKEVLDSIENTQQENIEKSADIIVNSLINDGIWHLFDTGHMLMHEAIGRSGGMMAIRPVRVTMNVDNPTRKRSNVDKEDIYLTQIDGLAEFIVRKANMESGDVLIIGSVSGIDKLPVQMAIEAKKRGIRTIGITSVEYSKHLNSHHPSGKKLFEVCDSVIDNCGNIGDTLVYIDKLDRSMCPSSGLAASYIIWAIQCEVVERLILLDKEPSMYTSNHVSGALKANRIAWERYEEQGY